MFPKLVNCRIVPAKPLTTRCPLMVSSIVLFSMAQVFLQHPEPAPGVPGDETRKPEHDGHDDHRGQRQPKVQDKHCDQDTDQGEYAGDDRRHILRNSLVDGVNVIGQAAHQLPGRIAVEKAEGQFLQVAEQVLTKLFQGALGRLRP